MTADDSILIQAPAFVFGDFRLLRQQRLLYRANTRVHIGSRAREILVTLLERADEIVKKNELVARVWPNTIVKEGTLRVHIAALRKALNDGKDGARFVENVTGIGYRFIAPVALPQDSRSAADGAPFAVEQLRELLQLREENARLRRVVADLMLEKHILKEKIVAIPRDRMSSPAGSRRPHAHFP
jgi:DNA-binding winged helix-turn-helix (wHTH) protein